MDQKYFLRILLVIYASLGLVFWPFPKALAEGLRSLTEKESKLLRELSQPRRIIVAIGIDHFEDKFWNPLRYASNDARRVFEFLKQDAHIPFDAGELISTSTEVDGKVSRQDVFHALDRLKSLNVNEDDTVIVYLSTHGTLYSKKESSLETPTRFVPYFVMSDSLHQDIHHTAISRDDFIEVFQSLKSQRKALIIATCHSGGGKAQITPDIQKALSRLKGQPELDSVLFAGRGYSILAASSWSEPAAEDEGLGHDIYTYFLVEGMKKNKGGAFTLAQAHDYATRSTIAFTNNQQHPTILMDQSGGDPIVLSGRQNVLGLAYLYSYINTLRNYQLRIGGQMKGVVGDSGLMIPGGRHRLEIVDPETGQTIVSRVISLEAGKEYSIADLIVARNHWHFSVGFGHAKFHGREAEKRFAHDPSLVRTIAVRYDEAMGIWDAILSGSFASPQHETIQLASQKFPQTRSSALVSFGLGMRSRFLRTDFITGEGGWYAGPGILQLQRQIQGENLQAVVEPDAKVILPAFGAGFYFSFHHTRTGMEFGINSQFDSLWNRNQIEKVDSFFLSQISINAGVSW